MGRHLLTRSFVPFRPGLLIVFFRGESSRKAARTLDTIVNLNEVIFSLDWRILVHFCLLCRIYRSRSRICIIDISVTSG